MKNKLTKRIALVVMLAFVTNLSFSQCPTPLLGGKIFVTNSNCAYGVATLKLTTHSTGTNVTYQWQESNNNGLNYANSFGFINDTMDIDIFSARVYRCRVVCGTDTMYSLPFRTGMIKKYIKVDSLGCPGPGIRLSLARTTSGIDSAWGKSFLWQASTNGGAFWGNLPASANPSADSFYRVNLTSTPILYRCLVTFCPVADPTTVTDANAWTDAVTIGTAGAYPVMSTTKDCVNDTAKLSVNNIDSTLFKLMNIQWYSASFAAGPYTAMTGKTDSFLKVKVTNQNQYYYAKFSACPTATLSDSTAKYSLLTKLGTLTATLECPQENVILDYTSRDTMKSTFAITWNSSSKDSLHSVNIAGVKDSFPYKKFLINNDTTYYRVTSKFCSTSTNILDSTKWLLVELAVKPGNLKADTFVCPNDSVSLTVVNYTASSTFPILHSWQLSKNDTLSYQYYTQAPLSDSQIRFRMLGGLNTYRKATSLCPNSLRNFYSTVASTFLPNVAILNAFSCTGGLTVNVSNDTIKIKDYLGTKVRSGNFSYQWLISSDKLTYALYPGGNTKNLTITNSDVNKFFKRLIKICNTNTFWDTSLMSVSILPTPTAYNGDAKVSGEVCLDKNVLIKVQNFTPYPGQTPIYQWQGSDNQLSWYNLLQSNANDDSIFVRVQNVYKYYRRLTLWCPSGIVDSSGPTPVFYNQKFPWCEDFSNMIKFGPNALYNCWQYMSPACSNITSYNTLAGQPIFSDPSSGKSGAGFVLQQPGQPPVNKKFDGKFVTPAFYLEKDSIYRFSFWHKETSANLYWDSLYVVWGRTDQPCELTNRFGKVLTQFSFDQFNKFWADFIPSESGVYYFGVVFKDSTATRGDMAFDDFCLKPIQPCNTESNITKGIVFAPSKIRQDPVVDRLNAVHQYCIGDTLMLSYQEQNYASKFDYYGMDYEFYKKREDKDWKFTDSNFFKTNNFNKFPNFGTKYTHHNVYSDYHVINVMATDTDTYYKIKATCTLDNKVYWSDTLMVNGTHALPWCESWEGVGGLNDQNGAIPGVIVNPTAPAFSTTFRFCATCWVGYAAGTGKLEAISNKPNPWAAPATFVDLEPQSQVGFESNKAILNQNDPTRKVLVFPAVRLYKGRGYRITYKWNDNTFTQIKMNAANGTAPSSGGPLDKMDSMYVMVAKGNTQNQAMANFTLSKRITPVTNGLKSNPLASGSARYTTYWADYTPVDTGTYFFAISYRGNVGNSSVYKFLMDAFCIDTLSMADTSCKDIPQFANPNKVVIQPDNITVLPGNKVNYQRGAQWCSGNRMTLQYTFDNAVFSGWKYGYKFQWQDSAYRGRNFNNTADTGYWRNTSDTSNTFSFVLKNKQVNVRLLLLNKCKIGDTIGPFNIFSPTGLLPWREIFTKQFIPDCWEVAPTAIQRVKFGNMNYNCEPDYKSKDYCIMLDNNTPASANNPKVDMLEFKPPGFFLDSGKTYRVSFWYRNTGLGQVTDSIRVGQTYVGSNFNTLPASAYIPNKVLGNTYPKNFNTRDYQYYSGEYTALKDSDHFFRIQVSTGGAARSSYYTYLDHFEVKPKYNKDLVVIAIDSPRIECGITSKDVKAKVMNLGMNSPGTFKVYAQFGSNTPSSTTISTTMASNAVLSVTIPSVDFTGRGLLPLKVWTELAGDEDTWDDTLQINVNNKYLPTDPTEKGDTFCQGYNFGYYIAKSDPEDRVMWYKSPTDFLPFMEQDSVSIVNFQRDTTFYVSKGTSESVFAMPYDFSFGATSYATTLNGMVFDVIEKQSVLFQQVTLYAKNPGNSGLIRLRRYGLPVPGCPDVPTGAFTTAGAKLVTLNWILPPGHDYQISYIAATTNPVPLARISPTAQDPSWGIACKVKIKTPITIGTDFSYEYFFNFKFRFYGCESARKRIDLTLKKSPIVNLLDTNRVCTNPLFSICGPDPATGDTYTYEWSSYSGTGTTKCYNVGTSSPYEITVTNQLGCKGFDSTYIIVDPSPVFSVNDTFFCKNQKVSVDTKLSQGNNTIQWTGFGTGYGGGTGQTQTFGLPGTYYVTATSKSNTSCVTIDTFTVTQKELPIVEIGTQQIYCGSTAVLGQNLLSTNMSYVWAPTGDVTKNITVSQDGMYSVIGTDLVTGCVNYDTTTIAIKPKPSFDLGADINTCGTSVVINGPTNGKYYYHWSNNQTSKSIVVTTSGKYLLTVTDSFSGCTSIDSITVNFNNQLPIFNLGNDSSTCLTALTLNAPLVGSQYTYSWTGPLSGTASTLPINKSGVYKLVISNGCYSFADSIRITFMNSSLGLIDLLKDTITSCNIASLTATSNPTNATIIWSVPGNPRGNTITVSSSGSVSVSMSNQCGSATKSAYVRIDRTPTANFTIIYPSTTIPLIGLGDLSTNAITYNWSFGDGKTSTTSNPSHQYVAPGEYLVTLVVSNACGSSSMSKKTNKLNLVGSGIVTSIADADMILYPNPANTYSKVVASNIQNGDYTIEMYNGLGQLVLAKETTIKNQMFDEELKIDLFATGEYLVKVTNQKDGISIIKKLQIIK